MKEYMLRVLNVGTHQKDWAPAQHIEFVEKCESYINELKREGKLIAAQPLAKKGVVVVRHGREWGKENLDVQQEIQVGYYHIRAANMDDAIAIAKNNPEFEYGNTARVEVRPVKEEEESTGFVYPK
jgi:hypothetical protein